MDNGERVMSTHHTPTPWEARGGGHSTCDIADMRPDMMDWCSSIDCKASFTENEHGNYEHIEQQAVAKAYGRTLEEAQVNAAHIVRCVNSHDALVAALRQIERLGREGTRDGQLIRDSLTDIASAALAATEQS